jgi:hypothetical protein
MKLRCIKDTLNGERLMGLTIDAVYRGQAVLTQNGIMFLVFDNGWEWNIYGREMFIPATLAVVKQPDGIL